MRRITSRLTLCQIRAEGRLLCCGAGPRTTAHVISTGRSTPGEVLRPLPAIGLGATSVHRLAVFAALAEPFDEPCDVLVGNWPGRGLLPEHPTVAADPGPSYMTRSAPTHVNPAELREQCYHDRHAGITGRDVGAVEAEDRTGFCSSWAMPGMSQFGRYLNRFSALWPPAIAVRRPPSCSGHRAAGCRKPRWESASQTACGRRGIRQRSVRHRLEDGSQDPSLMALPRIGCRKAARSSIAAAGSCRSVGSGLDFAAAR